MTNTNNHGGARPGAGRPMATDPRQTQSISMRQSLVVWLADCAKRYGLSKSAIVEAALEEYREGK